MARRLWEQQLQEKIGAPSCPDKFTGIKETGEYEYAKTRKGVYCMQFAPDSSYLAVGYTDGSVEAIDVQDSGPTYIKDVKKKKYGNEAATCMRFHPKKPTLCYVSTAEGTVEACDYETGANTKVIDEDDNHIQALDFDNRGKVLLSGGTDLNVRAYDASTHQEIRCMEGYRILKPTDDDVHTHSQRIFALKFHPTDYDVFLTGGWENNIKIWDLRRANPVVNVLEGPHICGDTIDFQGTQILCGSWTIKDGLTLWDYTYREKIKSIPMHQAHKGQKAEGDYVYCCQFCSNDVILAGGSGTHSVQAINKETNEFLGEIMMQDNKPVQALDVTQGGQKLAFGGIGEILRTGKLL